MHNAASETMIPHKTPQQSQFDPLLAHEVFPYRCVFYPLGFAVEIETNSQELLLVARESWTEQTFQEESGPMRDAMRLRIGVTPSASLECPPTVSVRAFGHLLSIIADVENFAVCDLQQGFAFGWVNEACLRHGAYFRYHFLEAAAMCLLVGSRVTPIHAACVSYQGRGMLLYGESGAGKSTLAYACARAGFAFTTDDASYVLWSSEFPLVRGNAHQMRFRPTARDLFPELQGLSLTPRVEGKPSIVVRTSELPGIVKAPEAQVYAILILNRHAEATVMLQPLSHEEAMSHLEAALFPLDGIRQRQASALHVLRGVPIYELRYRDLEPAIARLKQLATEVTKG